MDHENGPLVTAVIPVYNHEKYVAESIRSILQQTYRNIELIVINDGSRDRSHEIVLSLAEECRQRFVRFEYINRQNIGLSATLNQAIGMAEGEYLSALASDDVALPEKIETLVTALQGKDRSYAAAFGDALFIDGDGRKLYQDEDGSLHPDLQGKPQVRFLEYYTKDREVDYRSDEFGSYKSLITGNYLPAMSNIVRTQAILEAGGWTRGNVIEDWEMWLKLSKKYKFLLVDKPVALYRWHELNTGKNTACGLVYASLILVDREREFCSRNNLLPAWKNSHNALLHSLIFNNKLSFHDKLSLIGPEDLTYICKSGVIAKLNRLTNKMSR